MSENGKGSKNRLRGDSLKAYGESKLWENMENRIEFVEGMTVKLITEKVWDDKFSKKSMCIWQCGEIVTLTKGINHWWNREGRPHIIEPWMVSEVVTHNYNAQDRQKVEQGGKAL